MNIDPVKVTRALLSVSDKTNLDKIATTLHSYNIEIISSGGTGKTLKDMNIPFTPIEEITKNPESFGGRMKTLSFQIASGLLFRRSLEEDQKQADELGIKAIDLVVCNLYPFEEVASREHTFGDLIENIDIGGPTMIRAAAKNFEAVTVCTSIDQYDDLISALKNGNGTIDFETRRLFSLEAFRHTTNYDFNICNEFEKNWNSPRRTISFAIKNSRDLRYGENPHQKAWVYDNPLDIGIANTIPLQGKALSYNNLLDADAAWRSTCDLNLLLEHELLKDKNLKYAVTIIKHSNPCGAAIANDPIKALEMAWNGDPISSFGSIICFNSEVDGKIASWFKNKFIELILAPSFSKEALDIFAKKKNLRLIPAKMLDEEYRHLMVRTISGGAVVQTEDSGFDKDLKTVTKTEFPEKKLPLAYFGTVVAKHLRSNAIALVAEDSDGLKIAGAGMGNPNRLVSVDQAVDKAQENGYKNFNDLVLISDAFLPFADNIDMAQDAKIKYVVQPGGSINDHEVITACNKFKISMIFTGRRHFRH